MGTIPFGYRLDSDCKRLVTHADEQQVLAVIRALRAAGASLRAVAAELNRRGSVTRAGGVWRFEYIRNLMKEAA